MGTITTGVGLISGIDTASLVESLLAIEGQGKARLEDRIASLQAQQTALLDINARLLNLKGSAGALSLTDNVFRSVLATSSDEEVLTATATSRALPGTFQFTVRQLAAASQQMTRGFADLDTTLAQLGQTEEQFLEMKSKGRRAAIFQGIENELPEYIMIDSSVVIINKKLWKLD